MKIILPLLFLFLLSTAFAQWEILSPSPIIEDLSEPAFINQEEGFVSAGDGLLYKTSDGFNSFEKVVTGAEGRIYRSQFIDKFNGYIIMTDFPGYGKELLKTTDGGNNWIKLIDSLLFRPMGVSFINKDTGWVSTWDKVLYTSNGGNSWEVRFSSYRIVKFLDQFNGLGISGDAYKTTDGGYSWQPLSFPGIIMQEIVMQDSNRIMMVGKISNNMVLAITFDGGINWTQINTPLPSSNSYDLLLFEDSTITISSGSYSKRSDDLGANWTSIHPTPPFNYGILANYCFNEKYYFFGLNGLIISSTDHGITWNNLGSEHGGGKIFFVDDLNGYTAPWHLTTDGGINWMLKPELIPEYLGGYDFHFFTTQRGIFAYLNRLYQTTNSGIGWDALLFIEEYFVGLIFLDSLYGYAHTIKQTSYQQWVNGIRKTTDGGFTWSDYTGIYEGDKISFVTRDLGFASNEEGSSGSRTTNGGISWYPNQFGRSYSISMIDSLTGFGTKYNSSSENYQLLKTIDGGNTYIILNEDIPVSYIYFIDQLSGWGYNRDKIYGTTDGGITWVLEFQGMNISQLYLHKTDLFAVGVFGVLLKRTGPLTGIQFPVSDSPDKFILYQNHPNPFNPSTTIRYSVAASSFVTIKLFDILGREIRILINSEHTPGNYSVDFNAEGLSSGVYIYRLSAGGYNKVRKMQLMR